MPPSWRRRCRRRGVGSFGFCLAGCSLWVVVSVAPAWSHAGSSLLIHITMHPILTFRLPAADAEEQAEAANYARLEMEEARREAAAQVEQLRSELWAAEARANLAAYGTPEGGCTFV